MASLVVPDAPDDLIDDGMDQLSPLVTQDQARARRFRHRRIPSLEERVQGRRSVSISESIAAVRRLRTSSQSSGDSSLATAVASSPNERRFANPFRPDPPPEPPSEPSLPQLSTSAVENTETPGEDEEKAETTAIGDLELEGWQGSCCCHPQSVCHRLIALALMCFLGFGSYFCFDNPGALQEEIKNALSVSTYQFSTLYAWYSWPNVLLPIIGGYLMDVVFGIRLGTVIYAFFIILGQGIFSYGALRDSFGFMQIGRFVFGIGGESLAVAQNTYAVSWFKGKELNMVFGFQLSVARVGSTVNFAILAPLYQYISQWYPPYKAVGMTLLISGCTCILSFLCAVVLGVMDKRVEILVRSRTKSNEKKQKDVFRVKDVLEFPASFWLLSVVCLAYYVAIFPFISLGQVFFMKKFGFTKSSANFINGLLYLLSAPASPLLGYLIDRTGRNVTYCIIAILATLFAHVLLAFSFLNPYIAICVMGMAYSLLASALWPIAALVIPEYQLGTAYGIMQAIQNAGLGVATLLAGLIVDKHGYIWLELFFIMWLVVALLGTIGIWMIDFHGSGYLNMDVASRDAYDQSKKQAGEDSEQQVTQVQKVLRPRTAEELRNRYLHRIGAALPSHLGHPGLSVVRNADGTLRPATPEPTLPKPRKKSKRPRLRMRLNESDSEDDEAVRT